MAATKCVQLQWLSTAASHLAPLNWAVAAFKHLMKIQNKLNSLWRIGGGMFMHIVACVGDIFGSKSHKEIVKPTFKNDNLANKKSRTKFTISHRISSTLSITHDPLC